MGVLGRVTRVDQALLQIVGGGTAGLATASRLAAAPNVTVAVVEAGSFYEFDGGNRSQVPGYGSTYLAFRALAKDYQLTDWDLITANQSVRLGCCDSPRYHDRELTLSSCRGSMAAKSTTQQGKHSVGGNLSWHGL